MMSVGHRGVLLLVLLAVSEAVVTFTCPYTELGLEEGSASPKDVKKAYRKLSRTEHPDKGGTQARFDRIREAYEVLTDPKRKVLFEMGGADFLEKGDAGKLQQGKTVSYNLGIPLESVYNGADHDVNLGDVRKVCRGCKNQPINRSRKKGCRGCGKCPDELEVRLVQMMPGFNMQQQVQVPSKERCRKSPLTIKAHVEAGMKDGHKMSFPAAAEQRPGLIPGDVQINLQVQSHKTFTRKGNDLNAKLTLTLKESLLGFTKTVRHMDGHKVEVSHKGLTQPGQSMLIRGEGMPLIDTGGTEFGDLYVKFSVQYPTSISQADKALVGQCQFA